jgi:ABC-type phosphate transport system permease subunit
VFLSEIAPRPARVIAEPVLQLLAGIPAVVYGFVGYATLVPFMERWLPTGETILVAAIVLALMVLPFIAAMAAEAFSLVPADLRRAGLSLGVSRWYTFSRITLRKAAPGVTAGIILGLGRGLGETLAVLMLTGNSPVFPDSILGRGQPLTALIATDLGESAIDSERYHALFSAGLLLMASVIAINVAVFRIKRSVLRAGSH